MNLAAVALIAGPNDDVVGKSSVADPALLSIDDIATIDLFGGSSETGCVTAEVRFCEAERKNFL